MKIKMKTKVTCHRPVWWCLPSSPTDWTSVARRPARVGTSLRRCLRISDMTPTVCSLHLRHNHQLMDSVLPPAGYLTNVSEQHFLSWFTYKYRPPSPGIRIIGEYWEEYDVANVASPKVTQIKNISIYFHYLTAEKEWCWMNLQSIDVKWQNIFHICCSDQRKYGQTRPNWIWIIDMNLN